MRRFDLAASGHPCGATVLDIGAGSGRDAAWFAANDYDVVAVKPSETMLAHARRLHPSSRIHWLAGNLPDLANVRRLGISFDLILLSAVWMHIPPAARERAMETGDAHGAEKTHRDQPVS